MTNNLERFYYTQDGVPKGPYLRLQIHSMIRQGIIRADATIRSQNGAEGTIDDFVSAYGWTDENDEVYIADRLLFWVKRIGLVVIIGGILIILFGLRIQV